MSNSAGFNVPIESGSHDNEGGSPGNAGQVEDLTAYIETVSVASGQLLRGTFIVGGFIAGTGACDGFGFVRLVSDSPFESLVSRFAGGLGLLALLILLMLFLRRGSGGSEPDEATAGTGPVGEPDAQDMERTADEGPGPPSAASFACGAVSGDEDEDEDLDGDEDDHDSVDHEPGTDDPPKRDDLA